MDLGLQGKVAIVTGGARGIGAGISEVLAQEGANLVIDYRSDPQECEGFAERLLQSSMASRRSQYRRISAGQKRWRCCMRGHWRPLAAWIGWVNNAGVMGRSPIEEMPLSEWQRLWTPT